MRRAETPSQGWADKIHGAVINPSGPFAKGLFVSRRRPRRLASA